MKNETGKRVLSRISDRFTRATAQRFPLQTKEIVGPLQFTPSGVFCWFILSPLNWEFLTLVERIAVWDVQRSRFGQLAESAEDGIRPIRIRRTTRPYAAFEWAAALDAAVPDPLPAVDDGETWDDYLAHGQRRLRSTGLDERLTAVGLRVADTPKPAVIADLAENDQPPGLEATRLLDAVLELEDVMSGGSLDARRARASDMAFLLHRSLAMGVPAPQSASEPTRWHGELGEFTDRTMWTAKPFGSTVQIHSETDAREAHRHVVTMTMGVMPDQTWPERGTDAWMMASDRLGFPVEWSLNGMLMSGAAIQNDAVFEFHRAEGIEKHYARHQETPPPAVARAIEGATETRDEVTEGTNRTGPRFRGTVRAAVYAPTEEEASERARKLMLLYNDSLHMPLTRTLDQARALREFVPGEPRVQKGWTRRFSVGYLAAAMPHIDAAVGTPSGPYIGYTSLSHRAVLNDLHYGPEQLNASGMVTVSASQGGGKSMLMGAQAYNAARAGEHTIMLDPSGPLAALAELPELAPFSRVLNLTEAEPGTLSPHQMVPTPRADQYTDGEGRRNELELERAIRMAKAERQQLLFDVLRMELAPSVLRTPGVDALLLDAIRNMGAHPEAEKVDETRWNPRWAMQWLQFQIGQGTEDAALARTILKELDNAAEFPMGELIIPDHDEPIGAVDVEDSTLVIVTMPGLEPAPTDVDREWWGAAERYAQPLLHLAAFFATKFIYGRPRAERKNCFLDENHLMARWGSGRAFNLRLARDSRKWNAGVMASSQDAADHLSIGNLDALVGGTWVGKCQSEAAARRGCVTLGISEDYFPVFLDLQPGEFVHRDHRRQCAKVKVDKDWHPSLASLETTPGRRRDEVDLRLEPTPFLDARLFTGHGLPDPRAKAAA
ncbi:ATP-binding protein [Enemella evansiae]|uniref:ATP-binding protein n=1 Tax=Enemella evansiae TaxID=2016499 RepID=UPI000B968FCD|nr:ATP-binding protein [Enemella evansiae]